jgi:tetraacyldisaccharide 4'-kinase
LFARSEWCTSGLDRALVVNVLSSIYGAAATWRRRWYANPARAHQLDRPVVSVGNLRAGGSGKTPIVAYLARLLASRGERPVILSRGYARTSPTRGVTVVSDGLSICADVAHAGDEPLMLARALAGIPVLVGADRFRSGRLAEREFRATVHVLDDGFQHVALKRDVDLLLVDADDLNDAVLPVGRLREPLTNAAAADAVLVTAADPAAAAQMAARLNVREGFRISRMIQPPRLLSGVAFTGSRTAAFAFAAIARADRFFTDLRAAGWQLAGTCSFRDHHAFTQHDINRVVANARAVGATVLVTTEKDEVRLAGRDFGGLPVAVVPLSATIEPAGHFAEWLMFRLNARLARVR